MSTGKDNLFWGPLENLRTLIASSLTFQVLAGVTPGTPPYGAGGPNDAAAVAKAKTHIYCPAIAGADVAAARPFALLTGNLRLSGRRRNQGAVAAGGEVGVGFEADVPAAHQGATTAKYAEAEQWFTELLGNIVAEMLDLSAGGAILDLTGHEQPEQSQRSDPTSKEDEGDFCRAILVFHWGVQA